MLSLLKRVKLRLWEISNSPTFGRGGWGEILKPENSVKRTPNVLPCTTLILLQWCTSLSYLNFRRIFFLDETGEFPHLVMQPICPLCSKRKWHGLLRHWMTRARLRIRRQIYFWYVFDCSIKKVFSFNKFK